MNFRRGDERSRASPPLNDSLACKIYQGMAGRHQADFVQRREFSLGINYVPGLQLPAFNPLSNHILYSLVSRLSVSTSRSHEGSANLLRVCRSKISDQINFGSIATRATKTLLDEARQSAIEHL